MAGLLLDPLVPSTRGGAVRREFASRGVVLQQADRLVVAAAVGMSAVPATGNPEGFPMSEVAVAHWPWGP